MGTLQHEVVDIDNWTPERHCTVNLQLSLAWSDQIASDLIPGKLSQVLNLQIIQNKDILRQLEVESWRGP